MTTVNSPSFWEQAYQEDRARWDMGTPTPIFQRLAESSQFSSGRMIVLGAGRGYDARMFAQHGFDVTAVDFAEDAARDMRKLDDPQAPIEILQADIFTLPATMSNAYDYLLEYTCFCAIDPQRRPDYADLVARLVRPGGTMIALVFPIWERKEGPPFAVTPEELILLLSDRGFRLDSQEDQPADSVSPRREFESLLVFRKSL